MPGEKKKSRIAKKRKIRPNGWCCFNLQQRCLLVIWKHNTMESLQERPANLTLYHIIQEGYSWLHHPSQSWIYDYLPFLNVHKRTNRRGVNARRHRPYFTQCSDCGRMSFSRLCMRCKAWTCDRCKPFLQDISIPHQPFASPDGFSRRSTLSNLICSDCQNELSGC